VLFGVDVTTVTNWERGRTEPAIRCLPAIDRFLGRLQAPPVAASLPGRLREARRRLGLSQARLAALLGVDEGSVAAWERGEHRPMRRCRKILEKFLSAARDVP